MMKLCYVDIDSGTDVGALFAAYRKTMAALRAGLPGVTLIHVTVPLMTEHGSAVEAEEPADRPAAGRGGQRGPGTAERPDPAPVRRATTSSTWRQSSPPRPTAAVPAGTYQGQRYYRLYDGYASDSGHLNARGSPGRRRRVAEGDRPGLRGSSRHACREWGPTSSRSAGSRR